MSDDDNDDLNLSSVFTEPPRPPSPEPTVEVYHRCVDSTRDNNDWKTIEIRLVGSHPLWGHHLWNAARSFASYLDTHNDLCQNRNILELGAGGGLPGIVCVKNGANRVVLTDYPDKSLVDNMSHNVSANIPSEHDRNRISVQGYIWGHPSQPLLDALQIHEKFHLVILSDLVFNHSQHDALLTTCEATLAESNANKTSPEPSVLVFYTHHRPHLAHRDMEFFDKAQKRGWVCEEVVTEKFDPMFPEDSGAEEVRATVHGWRLTRGNVD